eukprot:GHVL01030771.1.p1 GENE.GHVL01030771.1~~GHVL01030771.1.p1  ORF type:complete len:326 (+),score=37.86 GHVL01030771.1:403-1380(+)
MATTISISFNSLGIAIVYLIGPLWVVKPDDIPSFLLVFLLFSFILAALTWLVFEEEPETPPSQSALLHRQLRNQRLFNESSVKPLNTIERQHLENLLEEQTKINSSLDVEELPMSSQVWELLFNSKGFRNQIISFSVAETLINVFSAQMTVMLRQSGMGKEVVALSGSFFILLSMLGSYLIAHIVDRTKQFKSFMVLVLSLCLLFCCLYIFLEAWGSVISILVIGFFVGPVQPIAVESSAEFIFPLSESIATMVMQVAGNALSAVMLLIFTTFKSPQTATWCLCCLLLVAIISAYCCDGELKRIKFESERSQIDGSPMSKKDSTR